MINEFIVSILLLTLSKVHYTPLNHVQIYNFSFYKQTFSFKKSSFFTKKRTKKHIYHVFTTHIGPKYAILQMQIGHII